MSAPAELDEGFDRTRSWNAAMVASPGNLDVQVRPELIDGTVPSALRGGRLLSNGPGWTHIGGRAAHPFDGHGYVRAFEFLDDGAVRLHAKFVSTPSYVAEAAAGRLVNRGFATNTSDLPWKNVGFGEPRNVANTTIVRWGHRLLAGWEAGNPYALSPATLDTIGEEQFGGLISGQATLAHMHHDHANARLVLCSVKNGRKTQFTFREIDRDEQLMSSTIAEIDGMVFTHDFALTPNWYALGGNPLRLKPFELAKMALGSSTLLRSVTPDARQDGLLHLIPRGSGQRRTIRLPDSAFIIHFGNAFESDGDIVIDACVFSHFELGNEFGYTGPNGLFDPTLPDRRGPQKLVRIRVPAHSDEASWELLTEHGVDFPRFHPHHEGIRTPVMFGATRRDPRFSDPFDSVIRIDLLDLERPPSLWTAPDNCFVGEPIFVPDSPTGSSGHVLAVISDGIKNETRLTVFDAVDIARGPVAVVPLPLLPIAFHGEWEPRTPSI